MCEERAQAVAIRVDGAAEFAHECVVKTLRDGRECRTGQLVALRLCEFALPASRFTSAFGTMRFRKIHRHKYSLSPRGGLGVGKTR